MPRLARLALDTHAPSSAGWTPGHRSGRHTRRRASGAWCVFIALLFSNPAGAATFRWVDAQGKVHYSDSPPTEPTGAGHSELDAQGRVTKRAKAVPSTPEARKQQELEASRLATEEREARERRRRDNALLATYRSVSEIDRASERALELEQSLLNSLLTSRKHASGKAETELIDSMIQQRQQIIESVKARYAADKTRYIELTGKR